MIVILQKDLKGTGKAGDVVKVSDGYARNMLIPRGIAKEATEGNIKNLKKQQEIAAEKRAEQKAAAEANAKRIGDLAIEIKTKGGEGGRLFGSITSKDIAQALEEQHQIKIDKKKVELPSAIKEFGSYDAAVRLYAGVVAPFKLKVEEL